MGGWEGVNGLGGGEGLLAECCGFAALCGVEDEDAVGEGGDAGVAAVGRRRLSGKVERSRRRPAVRGWCQGRGMRMLARPRAGQIMTDGEGGAVWPGWDAGWCRSSSRNSFSMGDWKPPMRVTGVAVGLVGAAA